MILNAKKILIVGDSGRGKTTFAQELSKKTHLSLYSTDDFFWEKKFTIKNSTDEALANTLAVYNKEQWIVEGSTRHLLQPGFEHADLIFNFGFKNLFSQYYFLFKRHLKRDDEKFSEFFYLVKHIFFKRYKLRYAKNDVSRDELLKPHRQKVVSFHSFKEINNYLNSL